MATYNVPPPPIYRGVTKKEVLPYETPHESIQPQTHMNSAAISRLEQRAGLDANICLITLESHGASIDRAHIVDRANLPKAEVLHLEYIFGLPPDEFHSDSSFNVVYLRRDIHVMLDQFGCAILPSLKIMEAIHEYFKGIIDERKQVETSEKAKKSKKKGTKEAEPTPFKNWKEHDFVKNVERFQYYFIPLLCTQNFGVVIDRANEAYFDGKNFPVLSSWINPLTAIWNAGPKIDALDKSSRFSLLLLGWPTVQLVTKAYEIWRLWKSVSLPQEYVPQPPKSILASSPTRESGPSKSQAKPQTRSQISIPSKTADDAQAGPSRGVGRPRPVTRSSRSVNSAMASLNLKDGGDAASQKSRGSGTSKKGKGKARADDE